MKGYYLNLLNWRRRQGHRSSGLPTFPTNLGKALRTALRRILDEGLENRFARHARAAAAFRAGVKALSFRSCANEPFATPTVSTMVVPDGLTAVDVAGWLERERNILLCNL